MRPLLFRLDAEQAHHLTLLLLRRAGHLPLTNYLLRSLFDFADPRLEVEAFGLKFKNPIGLAGGYDKDGIAVRGLACLGFGHVEVGTVTLRPQPGNPRPRLLRVPEANALINTMGFPSAGIDQVRAGSDEWRAANIRVGINLGKNKDTPLDRATEEYCEAFRRAQPCADYVSLNVSSPNTVGLRQLQARAAIADLLKSVTAVRDELRPRVPLLVKIAPDLTESEIDDVLAVVSDYGLDGIIATNATTSRAGTPEYAVNLPGGLSGPPLRARVTEIVRHIARRTDGKLPIIGVGGIASPDDALEKLEAGARLVQVYTGLVYRGPGLVKKIKMRLLAAR